jgi:hypothetical protein
MIKQKNLVPRGVYRVHSRNLVVAVWNGSSGFIGIRHKFDDSFLFTEYHYDDGPPYGTLKPIELITILPEGIEIVESTPTKCTACQKEVVWEKDKGWSHSREASPMCDKGSPASSTYKPLFDFLAPLEKEENDRLNKEYDEKYGKFESVSKREEDADDGV